MNCECGVAQVLLACQALLIQVARTVSWVGYVSSTGVYGDHQGDWVDEECALQSAVVCL